MSFPADNFKQFSRKAVSDLCQCLSNVCGNNTDEAGGDQTSLKLTCLTTCYHWFRRKEQPVDFKILFEDFVRLVDLVTGIIQTDTDPFVLHAAHKALKVLLENKIPKIKLEEYLHKLLDYLGNKEIGPLNKTTILETTSNLLQGDLTIAVLDVVRQRFPWLIENVVKFPTQEDDTILLTTFLTMWRKSAQKCQDLQLDWCWSMDYEILLQTLNTISVTENHIYFRQVIHLLKTFYSYGQILCLQNSVKPIYIDLGMALLHWTLDRGIPNLHQESTSGFGGTCILVSCKSKLQTEFGNLSSLRQLASLLLSVAATMVRFSESITDVNIALSDLSRCLSQLDDHATTKVHGSDHRGQPFDWMTVVFGDQDDTLMESLLAVLDIYCITKKRLDTLGPYLEKLIATINPHRQFYLLLHMTSFDHSVMVDLLTSPETCALLYLTRYLKCVINEWDIFLKTLEDIGVRKIVSTSRPHHSKSDSVHCFTNIQGANFSRNSQEGAVKCFVESHKQSQLSCADKVQREDNEDDMNTSSIPASDEPVTGSPIKMECNESQFVTDVTSSAKTEHCSVTECVSVTKQYPESEFVKGSLSSAVTSTECKSGNKFETGRSPARPDTSVPGLLDSPGLLLLGQYSDNSDSDDSLSDQMSNDRSVSDDSKIVSQMETMEIDPCTLSDGSPNEKRRNESRGQTVSVEAIEICGSQLKVNQCLDETMATLIRLRLKMESLRQNGLLVYNPGPLIRLITQCETLYEQ